MITRALGCLAVLWCCLAGTIAAQNAQEATANHFQPVRFVPVDVWIDTKDAPLAAYQIEIAARSGNVQIVGIEGGSHRKYSEPPYYDPMAMQHDRVIIADFSTAPGSDLPSGRTRLVTIHLQITGEDQPIFDTKLHVAADVDGHAINADMEVIQGQGSES